MFISLFSFLLSLSTWVITTQDNLMNFTQAMNDLISDIDKYGCQNGGYNYTDDTKGVIPRVVYMKKKT